MWLGTPFPVTLSRLSLLSLSKDEGRRTARRLLGWRLMLARIAALGMVLAAVLLPCALRKLPESHRSCVPEGRGAPPRHWLGCPGDPGPPRDLLPDEQLALGLPIDLNEAGERELAFVPGLSRRLARAVVEHREAFGPFRSVDDLLAVKGIGPRRLEQARPRLLVRGAQ